jgi:hypothetical protein
MLAAVKIEKQICHGARMLRIAKRRKLADGANEPVL